MADPSSIIGLASSLFSLSLKLYNIFQSTLEFTSTSETLLLQLEVEHARLVLWGRNSGLAEGTLRGELVPLEGVIMGLLRRLSGVLEDSKGVRERFGLVEVGVGVVTRKGGEGERSLAFVRIRDGFRNALSKRSNKPKDSSTTSSTTTSSSSTSVSLPNRIKWAITSQSHFESLISTIHQYINSLNDLLRESESESSRRMTIRQDWNRVKFDVVGGLGDWRSLMLVRDVAAGAGGEECTTTTTTRDLWEMAVRKAIVLRDEEGGSGGGQGGPGAGAGVVLLRKEDFEVPHEFGFGELTRCIARFKHNRDSPLSLTGGAAQNQYVLIEKKRYESTISTLEKEILRNRLWSLIKLLNVRVSVHASSRDWESLPFCIGYWHEPENYYWCLVYHLPSPSPSTSVPPTHGADIEPPTLLTLIQTPSFRPPLEDRLTLSHKLSIVFARLWGSKWFHKGIRSANIVFPSPPASTSTSRAPSAPGVGSGRGGGGGTGAGGGGDITTPIILGFEYSRMYTEELSIDFGGGEIEEVVYRHPDYQAPSHSPLPPHTPLTPHTPQTPPAAGAHAAGAGSAGAGAGGRERGGGRGERAGRERGGGTGGRGGGYRMTYDIYSFGLLLAEIAWWVPIEGVYNEMVKKQQLLHSQTHSSHSSHSHSQTHVSSGSGAPTQFHTPQAAQKLKEEILKRVKKELGFRVGSVVRDVVLWCLDPPKIKALSSSSNSPFSSLEPSLESSSESSARSGLINGKDGEDDGKDEEDSEAQMAGEFYENVVVPLERLCRMC